MNRHARYLILVMVLSALKLSAQDVNVVRETSDTVAFLYPSASTPCAQAIDTTLIPLGSAFYVGIPLVENGPPLPEGRIHSLKLLVTANHVLLGQHSVVVRINTAGHKGVACKTIDLHRDGPQRNLFEPADPAVDLAAFVVPTIEGGDPLVLTPDLILADDRFEEFHVQEGTEIFTVGYLFGYSGFRHNLPVAKFGRVALLSDEPWFTSPAPRNQSERAHLVELQNVPGLSGAPLMLYSPQFRRTAQGTVSITLLKPYVIGVIKGLLGSPIGGSQGVAAIEPATNLLPLLRIIADFHIASGLALDTRGLPASAKSELGAPPPN